MKRIAGFIMAATIALASVFALSGCSFSPIIYTNAEQWSFVARFDTEQINVLSINFFEQFVFVGFVYFK